MIFIDPVIKVGPYTQNMCELQVIFWSLWNRLFFCTLLDEKNVINGIPFQHKHDALNSLFYQPKVEKLLLGATSLCKPLYRLNGKLFKSWLSSPRKGLGSDLKKKKTKLSKTNTTCGKLLNSKLLKLLVLVMPISYHWKLSKADGLVKNVIINKLWSHE